MMKLKTNKTLLKKIKKKIKIKGIRTRLKNIYITNHDGMMKLKINKTFIK